MDNIGERVGVEEERKREGSESSFTSAMMLALTGDMNIPKQYVLPPLLRPNPSLALRPSSALPIIDFSLLQDPLHRSQIIDQLGTACMELGFFQIINHGVPASVMNNALHVAKEFFNLPSEEKMYLLSDDVYKPVRYGTSINHMQDKVFFWRDFIKHYSHPVSKWIDLWPVNPKSYKEKMGRYAKAVYMVQKVLMEAVLESLGLTVNYLHEDIEEGSQVMAVNCYPPCPEPDLALGMPPHSDYGSLTILNQNQPGLEIMDRDNKWHAVPHIQGALVVQLGDQIEIMSNGRYKSIIHRATVNSHTRRISIASLHSLPLERKVGPAPQLVDEQHPIAYKEVSFGDFLDYISLNSISKGRYIETLKKKSVTNCCIEQAL